jgi:hypothetical protein
LFICDSIVGRGLPESFRVRHWDAFFLDNARSNMNFFTKPNGFNA